MALDDVPVEVKVFLEGGPAPLGGKRNSVWNEVRTPLVPIFEFHGDNVVNRWYLDQVRSSANLEEPPIYVYAGDLEPGSQIWVERLEPHDVRFGDGPLKGETHKWRQGDSHLFPGDNKLWHMYQPKVDEPDRDIDGVQLFWFVHDPLMVGP